MIKDIAEYKVIKSKYVPEGICIIGTGKETSRKCLRCFEELDPEHKGFCTNCDPSPAQAYQ